jgi:hypothetical protein
MDRIVKLNKVGTNFRDNWENYPDARSVMNYRRNNHPFNNDKNYQWEHTVEQSARKFKSEKINSLDNLSWTPTNINSEANESYQTVYDTSKLRFLQT